MILLERLWSNSASCAHQHHLPPTALNLFNVHSNQSNASPATSSHFYKFVTNEYAIGTCGNLNQPLAGGGCCYSSLSSSFAASAPSTLVSSNGVKSGSFDVVSADALDASLQFKDFLPSLPRSTSYCIITNLAFNTTANTGPSPPNSTTKYIMRAFYGDASICHQGQFKCIPSSSSSSSSSSASSGSATLKVYKPGSGCMATTKANVEDYQLLQPTLNISASSAFMGNVSFRARFAIVGGGSDSGSDSGSDNGLGESAKSNMKWVALTPSNLLVPVYHQASDYIGTLFYLMSCLGGLLVIIYLLKRYQTRPTKYMFLMLTAQILWLLWVFGSTGYYFWVFERIEEFAVYKQVIGCLFNAATFSTVMNSTLFILKYKGIKGLAWRAVCGLWLAILLIFFSGSLFFGWYWVLGPYQTEMKSWSRMGVVWIFVMFIFNFTPSLIVANDFMMITEEGHEEPVSMVARVRALYSCSPLFVYLCCAQLLDIVLYVTAHTVQVNTALLGDDRMFMAWTGVLAFLLVIHSILNCLFIENVGGIIERKSQMFSLYSFTPATTSLHTTLSRSRDRYISNVDK